MILEEKYIKENWPKGNKNCLLLNKRRDITHPHDWDMNGENNPFYGKHHTDEFKEISSKRQKGKIIPEETKKKMSEAHKGKIFTEKHKQRISLSHMGIGHSEETKKKISELKKNNKNMSGKHHTEETKNKISKANKGKLAGEKGPKAKLTWKEVNEIREKYLLGTYNTRILSEEYKVSVDTIRSIINYKTWKI